MFALFQAQNSFSGFLRVLRGQDQSSRVQAALENIANRVTFRLYQSLPGYTNDELRTICEKLMTVCPVCWLCRVTPMFDGG